ncbi:MAG: MFS transporter [Bryobacterales bacterium]|nr:MFS transporter [Bryobacteraceae bacterium]MDW8353504.1 MFS transporter [Bryobacterales bacterium]
MLRRVFKAFHYRDFRLLWVGACTSSIGTWMQKLAQSWLVLQISGSPFLLGLDAFLGEIPIFLFSLLGGVIADRMDRRYLLLVSQVVQMSCAFLLAALIALDLVRVWHILTLSFVVGTAQAFGGPAYQALVPSLVKPEDLANAIAWNSIQFNLARVVGPVLGGLALTQLGAAWCFGLNGVSYLAVIVSLLMLRTRFVPQTSGTSLVASMRQGIHFIRRRSPMESLILLAFLMTVLAVPLIVFLPVFVTDVFRKGPSTYTLLLSVSGAGSVMGALIVAALGNIRHKGRTALVMLILLGLGIVAFALSTSVALSCVLLLFCGVALIAVFSLVTSLVQLITVDEMRGRVMSVYNVAFRGGMPIGSLLTGSLVPVFSAPAVLAFNGLALVALGTYFLLLHRRVADL